MQVKTTAFEGLLEIIPTIFYDPRGSFYEFYKEPDFHANGIKQTFVQDNISYSKKGVVRGLHFQIEPFAQVKLVTALTGKALDIAVDIRPGSKTFGMTFSCILDSAVRNMLLIPEGFAHGFAALEETLFYYKSSNVYNKASERGIHWQDPQLNIQWNIDNPVVSEKDQQLPTLEEFLRNQ